VCALTPRPNILFILSDQHNAKCLGHRGHPNAVTPSLDRLAAEGVRFESSITQSPICTPSRVSMISGQYCHNHGYYGFGGTKPQIPTIFGHFRNAGYRTSAIGKIHCPDYWVEDDCDEFHETSTGCSVGGRSAQYTAYLREHRAEHLEDHETLPEFGPAGGQSVDGRPSLTSFEVSTEGWSVQQAASFMARCKQDNVPFFAHVSFSRPHQCFTPAQQFWDLYDFDKLVLPPNAEYDMTGQSPLAIQMANHYRERPWPVFEPKTFEAARLRRLRGYLGNVSHVDHAVGLLLDALRQNGLEENTIVVYSADHGDYTCEHGLMEKAPGICHDAVTRVPMLWRWPAVFKPGHVANEIVQTIDIAPTLCALADLPAMPTADGKDLSSLLRGGSGEVNAIGVTEFAWSRSVRRGRYRYVYYPRRMFAQEYPNGFGQLYDLEADPWEMRNLYFDSAHGDVVRELREELFDWLVTTTRPVTVLGIDQRRNRRAPGGPLVRVRNKAWSYLDGKISPQALEQAADDGRAFYL